MGLAMSKRKNDVSQKLKPNTLASDDDGSATDLRLFGFNAWGAEQGNLFSHWIEPPDSGNQGQYRKCSTVEHSSQQ